MRLCTVRVYSPLYLPSCSSDCARSSISFSLTTPSFCSPQAALCPAARSRKAPTPDLGAPLNGVHVSFDTHPAGHMDFCLYKEAQWVGLG